MQRYKLGSDSSSSPSCIFTFSFSSASNVIYFYEVFAIQGLHNLYSQHLLEGRVPLQLRPWLDTAEMCLQFVTPL